MDSEKKNTIDVIVIAPGKAPEKKTISDELKSFQEIVGGYIEEIYPFEDEVAVVCNEEGKLVPLPRNRALISNETGIVMDIVYGTFLLAYAPVEEESYQDMPPNLTEKYMELFAKPERFYKTPQGIVIEKFEPKTVSKDAR